ncbi:MAG: glycosyltransferase [Phycisphaerae bacterium]|nr:glycosyltransferase [Phycisphaerae bacterium]
MKDTPVALVCYNRPWHTAQVLKALFEHNVQNLYIFIDGPRTQGDIEKIDTIKKLAGTIKWTSPAIICRETNRGLARSVVGAVDHVLGLHDRLILLEDDCVPGSHFFEFMDQCLTRYADHGSIFGINGYTVPIPDHLRKKHPYDLYFYPRIGSWGWATWKRAWRHFDPDLSMLYNRAMAQGVDLTQGGEDIPSQVQRVLNGHDAWTLNWVLATYLNNGCYIYPTESHIQNIGFDGSGTNFGTSRSKFENQTSVRRPTRYPADVIINQDLVDYYNSYFKPKSKAGTVMVGAPSKQTAEKPRRAIIHMNTHDAAGGAAKVGFRLAEAQRSKGHDAVMLTGVKNCNSPHTFAFDPEHKSDILSECRSRGLLYYESQGSHKLVQNELVKRADILHLHNLHGYYFNPFSLPALSQLKPTVWTLHDMQAFTGHCAYALGCTGWQTGCQKCDHLEIPPELPVDTAAQLLRDKQEIYDHSRLWLVTPSNWLKKQVEQSVLRDHPVELIYNGVDTTVFRPYPKTAARKELGIPDDAFVIGSVAVGSALNNPFKGGQYTRAVLDALSGRISNHVFLNVGGRETGRNGPILNTGTITDEHVLARTCSAMDVFLYTPLADNCPLVVLEALACGVPVAAFDIGGVGELVGHERDGLVTEYKDVAKMAEAVRRIAGDAQMRDCFSRNARQSAVSRFDHTITAAHYEKLYDRVLAECRSKASAAKRFTLARVPRIIQTPDFLEAEGFKARMVEPKGAAQEASTSPPLPTPCDVTIVLGTKDRAHLLDQMLTSLVGAVGSLKYEVIVIEGGSKDDTLNVLQKHGIRHVYSESQCLGPGRHSWSQMCNFGLQKAHGKWAMYGSDDIIFGKDCLAKAVETLNRQTDEVAAGLFFYKNIHSRPEWQSFGIDFTYGPKLLMNYGLFRLDHFTKVGGLNEQYRFYCADGDLCYRFYSAGKRAVVLPHCFVVHNNVLDAAKQQHADEAAADIALYKNNWKHFVPMANPNPRRLLWHADYAEAFAMPSSLDAIGPGSDAYWHGLACFQQGLFKEAYTCLRDALGQGFDHELVRWFLEQAHQRCTGTGGQRALTLADDFAAEVRSHEPLPAAPAPSSPYVAAGGPVISDDATGASDTLDLFRQRSLWRPGQPLRLHLGCGKWRFDGYVNIDYPLTAHTVVKHLGADFHADITQLNFPDQSVDEIRLHHVFEHFNRVTALAMLIRWGRWLKPGGTLRIETPDLIGSARTLLSDAAWKTKMGVIRHLAGDQAAAWGYHVDHWSAERFEHTLKHLGFEHIQVNTSAWPQEPYLSNVEVTAVKIADIPIEQQLIAADSLLWESTVAEKERGTWEVWRQQLRDILLLSAHKSTLMNDMQAAAT